MKRDRVKFIKGVVAIGVAAVITIGMLTGCQGRNKTLRGDYRLETDGSYTLELTPNRKLVNVSWRENELWLLTRKMKKDEEAETFYFKNSLNTSILEEDVKIVETKENK